MIIIFEIEISLLVNIFKEKLVFEVEFYEKYKNIRIMSDFLISNFQEKLGISNCKIKFDL